MTCYCCYWTSTPDDGCLGRKIYRWNDQGGACSEALWYFQHVDCVGSPNAYMHWYVAPDPKCGHQTILAINVKYPLIPGDYFIFKGICMDDNYYTSGKSIDI